MTTVNDDHLSRDWNDAIRAGITGEYREVVRGEKYRKGDEVPDGNGGWVVAPSPWVGKTVDGSMPVRRRRG